MSKISFPVTPPETSGVDTRRTQSSNLSSRWPDLLGGAGAPASHEQSLAHQQQRGELAGQESWPGMNILQPEHSEASPLQYREPPSLAELPELRRQDGENNELLLVPLQRLATGRLSLLSNAADNPVMTSPSAGPLTSATSSLQPDTTMATAPRPATLASTGFDAAGKPLQVATETISRSLRGHSTDTEATSRLLHFEATAEWLARRLQLVARDGHIDIRLRDYRLENGEISRLIDALLQLAEQPVGKITVNGEVVWRTSDTSELPATMKETKND